MRPALIMATAAISLAVLVVGCAPDLIVRHLDPAAPTAQIYVDGEQRGTVVFGDTLSVELTDGPHRIRAVVPGRARSIWHPGKDALDIIVDGEDVVLSLLPREDQKTTPTSPYLPPPR